MPRRHRLSTHLIRRTAALAQEYYEKLQETASEETPAGVYARESLAHLGVSLTDKIDVKPAKYERGNYVVISEPASPRED